MDYVGLMDLPKKFGREAIYRIRAAGDDAADRPRASGT
jgi:hypothetical protein